MSDTWGLALSGALVWVGFHLAWTGRPSPGRTVAGMLLTCGALVGSGWYLRGVVVP